MDNELHALEEAKTAEVVLYSETVAGLARLKEKYLDNNGNVVKFEVETTAGMALARESRRELQILYVDLDKDRKAKGEAARDFIKKLNTEAAGIDVEIKALYTPINKQIKDQEELKAKVKADKEAAEKKRTDEIWVKIEQLKAPDFISSLSTSAEILPILTDRQNLIPNLKPEEYAEFSGEAEMTLANVVALLERLYGEAVEREAKEAQLQREKEELEKQKAEQAEKERIAAEKAEKEEADRQAKIAAEQAERDKIQAQEDAKRKKEQEAADAKQKGIDEENERVKIEQEQTAEAQRQKEHDQKLEKNRLDEQRWRSRLGQLKEVSWNGQEALDGNVPVITYDQLINLSDEAFEAVLIPHNKMIDDRIKKIEADTPADEESAESMPDDIPPPDSRCIAFHEVLEFINDYENSLGDESLRDRIEASSVLADIRRFIEGKFEVYHDGSK